MQIDDEMIRNIEDDIQAMDPDGARRQYEKARRWNEYQRRYKLSIHRRPVDTVGRRNKKNIGT